MWFLLNGKSRKAGGELMELVVGVNSYITLEEAKEIGNDYIIKENVLTWFNALSDNDVSKLINLSTKKIDKVPYRGTKLTSEQKLAFPRLIANKQVDVNEDIKIACVLQAVEDGFSITDEEIQLKEKGVVKYSVDGASIEFSDSIGKDKLASGVNKNIYSEYLKKYSIIV